MSSEATRPPGANEEALPDDILIGVKAIARHLYGADEGLRPTNLRRVYQAVAKKQIPTFKIGGRIHARKSTIRQRIEAQEQAA
jgi:hypothetical protein